jgi:hypothetical protein
MKALSYRDPTPTTESRGGESQRPYSMPGKSLEGQVQDGDSGNVTCAGLKPVKSQENVEMGLPDPGVGGLDLVNKKI